MSRSNEAAMLENIRIAGDRMAQASDQFGAACSTILDVYARWSGYVSLETDADSLEASMVEFGMRTHKFMDDHLVKWAHSLDIMAGAARDANGNPMTRQTLLDLVAAVPSFWDTQE